MQKDYSDVAHHNKAHLASKALSRRILNIKAVQGKEKCESKGRKEAFHGGGVSVQQVTAAVTDE